MQPSLRQGWYSVHRQPVQESGNEQESLHSRVPQPPPQNIVAPGTHSPMPEQLPRPPHRQLESQVRVRVPQRSHGMFSVAPAMHSPSPPQVPQSAHPHDALHTRD